MDKMPSTITHEESHQFPVRSLLVAFVILAAAAAILVFKVPWTTVLYYGFFGLMLSSHFFMHGSHGGHNRNASNVQQDGENSHTGPSGSQSSLHNHADVSAQPGESEAQSVKDKDSHQGHSGCC